MPEPLPLFPLNTPLVPGLVLPLNIFEPRYRAMVQELLDEPRDEAREFGVIAIREGRDPLREGTEALYGVGVSALLRQAEELEDGRFEIVTTGHRRFRLISVEPVPTGVAGAHSGDVTPADPDHDAGLASPAPLLRAQVEFLAEATSESDALLADQVAARFREYRSALGGQVQATVGEDEIPHDPTVLSYLVTAAMVVPQQERQQLLSADSTAARLTIARGMLSRETVLISELSAVPSLDIPGATPSVN